MPKKMGLGKGLAALIPDYSEENKNLLKEINIDEITPNPNQPRIDMDQEKLNELADSIKEHGVIQPIIVRRIKKGSYQIIAGERRWRACKMLDLKTIPAIITEYSDLKSTEVALIENLQRVDLNPLEEALAYQSLINEFGITQEKLAKRVGKSRSAVANTLRLLSLPDDILQMLKNGDLTSGHARALLALDEARKQIAVAKEVVNKQLSVRQTERLVKKLTEQKQTGNEKNQSQANPELLYLQDKLQNIFSTKVQIKTNKKGKGKLEIEFYNQDDLNRIIDIVLKMQSG